MKEPVYVHKNLKIKNDECECGNLLSYRTSSFITEEKRVCLKCGKIHYVDYEPIDWQKNFAINVK